MDDYSILFFVCFLFVVIALFADVSFQVCGVGVIALVSFSFFFFFFFLVYLLVFLHRRKCSFYFNAGGGREKLQLSAGQELNFSYFVIAYKFEDWQGSLAVIRELNYLLFYTFQIFLLIYYSFSY